MNINFQAAGLDLTAELKTYVQEKMAMVEKFLGNIQVLNCDFEVGLISHHHNKGKIYRAEVNLNLPGALLRVEKTEKTINKAVDKVKDHLARAIKKYRDTKQA